MVKTGSSYQPELIELMKTALDEAAGILPRVKRTRDMKATLASRILSAAARGVRDPIKLRMAALMEIEEVNELYRSYAQLLRLRQQVEEAEATRAEVGSGRNEHSSPRGRKGYNREKGAPSLR